MRQQFILPEADISHLHARGLSWESIIERNNRWLLIHDFPIPEGYNHSKVIAAVRIDSGYPDTQLDMVYFYPSLALSNNKPIGALSSQILDGKTYQQWSRHRTPQNPWRPGEDDLAAHLLLVEYWLKREIGKG